MITVSLSPDELQDLIKSAVKQALDERLPQFLTELEEERIIDYNLGRLMHEGAQPNEKLVSAEEFIASLKTRLSDTTH